MRDEVKIAVYDRMIDPDFQWAKGHLRVGDTHCALGVVCELAIESGQVGIRRYGNYGYVPSRSLGLNNSSLLPAVAEWAGLTGIEECRIAEFNDKIAGSAADVAEWIKNGGSG